MTSGEPVMFKSVSQKRAASSVPELFKGGLGGFPQQAVFGYLDSQKHCLPVVSGILGYYVQMHISLLKFTDNTALLNNVSLCFFDKIVFCMWKFQVNFTVKSINSKTI